MHRIAPLSVIALGLLVWFWATAPEVQHPFARDGVPSATERRANTQVASLPAEIGADVRRELEPVRGANASPAPLVQHEDTQERVESIASELARLRALQHETRYHTLAWPTIEALAEKAQGSARVAAEMEFVLSGGTGDPARVRGSLLVATAIGLTDAQSRALAQSFVESPSPELERAGWIALALLAPREVEGGLAQLPVQRFGTMRRILALSGGEFLGTGVLPTYPLTFDQRVSDEEVNLALERVTRPLPPEPDGFDGDVEVFTRELVVMAMLGSAVTHPGTVRETMLDWLRYPTGGPEEHLMEAAAFVLTGAAREDPGLRSILNEIAGNAPPSIASIVLAYLARSGAGSEQVTGELARLVDAPLGDLGVPSEEQLTSIRALGELMASDDVDAFEAARIVVERVLDPARSPDERYFLLRELGTADPYVRAYASAEIVSWESDPMLVAEASLQLGSTAAIDGDLHRELLKARFADQIPLTRKAMVHALSELEGASSMDFLRSVASEDPDPGVRDYARRSLAR